MAQTGFTPIQIYSSATAAAAPGAGDLVNSALGSELAINITDGKLFYKDNANAVQVIAWKVTPATAGGTGLTSYTTGDLLYASSATTLDKLADVATGNTLLSGGVGVAPAWGKVGLTTHVSGTLPTANGGTNLTSFTANGIMYASSTSALATNANLAYNGTDMTLTGGNFVVGTSGKGIDFSATPGTGTSELLADYEKGTFTPTVIGTTTAGTATYAYAVGNYVKVGDAVNFQIIISWSAGTGTGNLALGGLPFTAGGSFYSVSIGRVDALALTANNYVTGYVEGATTNIIFAQTPTGGGAASQVPYDAAVDALFVSGTYLI